MVKFVTLAMRHKRVSFTQNYYNHLRQTFNRSGTQ